MKKLVPRMLADRLKTIAYVVRTTAGTGMRAPTMTELPPPLFRKLLEGTSGTHFPTITHRLTVDWEGALEREGRRVTVPWEELLEKAVDRTVDFLLEGCAVVHANIETVHDQDSVRNHQQAQVTLVVCVMEHNETF